MYTVIVNSGMDPWGPHANNFKSYEKAFKFFKETVTDLHDQWIGGELPEGDQEDLDYWITLSDEAFEGTGETAKWQD